MIATLTFSLPEEADEHRAALEGAGWRAAVAALDNAWRLEAKHGTPKSAARAEWARSALREAVADRGLDL